MHADVFGLGSLRKSKIVDNVLVAGARIGGPAQRLLDKRCRAECGRNLTAAGADLFVRQVVVTDRYQDAERASLAMVAFDRYRAVVQPR